MHIKQIIIQGFKSYKDQTVIEPFSPGHNVIVGRNGSGKSNFFAAIRFVLSDAYTQMGREERQALLHEGSGSAVMSAYVEIIFDNSDERFPTGKPELVLRRTIGLKKDEYSLDRKNATKADVMNLLESAGFSRSNPYYIVPQGRVTTLTNMKDGERLTLLKEVAGTQVYEARRRESIKIMQDTDNKRTKIDDLLKYIHERLAELEEEKEELRKYQEKDREHRCLQYTILHRTQLEYQRALESIDNQRTAGVEETDESREQLVENEQQIAEIDDKINDLKQQIDLLTMDKRQLDDERKETERERAKIELDVQQLTAGQSAAQQAKTKHDAELKDVKRLIKERETELGHLLPEYTKTRDNETQMQTQLSEAEATRKRLYAKQGRSAQFKNKRDRDDYLKREIEDVNMQLARRKAVAMQTDEEIVELNQSIATMDKQVTELRARIENRGDDMHTIAEEVDKARETRDRLMDERRELWREENRLQTLVQAAEKELDNSEQFLQRMCDRTTWQGIKSVRRIKDDLELDGVYGTLGELFEVSEKYQTAVEVTAGQSLLHYVVDTDETATKVLEVLQRERGGRVTFMPLNRLRPKPVNIPKASDAIHMVTKLKYDAHLDRAFQQVFGKMIICPSLQVAAQYARSHAVSAITPEGDRADKKGALTGGYHDPRQSRIDAMRREARWRNEVDAQRERYGEIKKKLSALDQEITSAVGAMQKVEQRRLQMEGGYGPLRHELRGLSIELQTQREGLERKQRQREGITMDEHRLTDEQEVYQAELAAEFKKQLSPDEERRLQSLSAEVQDLRRQMADLSSARSEIEARKTTLEVELRENLRLRLDNLNAREFEADERGGGTSGGTASSRLKERTRELRRLDKQLADVNRRVTESEESIENANAELAGAQGRKAEKHAAMEELQRTIARAQKRMEKSMQKKAIVGTKLAETTKEIRDLGVLPEDAFRRYEKWPSDKAMKKLSETKDALKKFSHVNKKAVEQYNNFTKQRETLTRRRGELDSSQKSIKDLIEHLDLRKDEAIERTFKQVSKEFAGVFERLVPAGKGRLIIQRKSDRQARGDDDSSEDEDVRKAVENYVGVGISVSFNSKHDEQQRIQQLSGGQKSLCALALVFAIQQCDPAPFYLFDEIDANLDAQYRTAVAQMLKTLSEERDADAAADGDGGGGQFICTTFRPEMVLVADKCYGVTYTNKTSSIDVVTRDQALEFVEGAAAGR